MRRENNVNVDFLNGMGSYPIFLLLLHKLFCFGQIRLHPEFDFPRSSGSSLIVFGGWFRLVLWLKPVELS